MKKSISLLFFLLAFFTLHASYHRFEGLSEIYNIRSPKILSKFLPERPVIIEVGAYRGRDTVKLCQKFPSAHIFAFEPLSTAFPILAEAVSPYQNVSLFNLCVDQTTGIRPFYIYHGYNGQEPIFEFHSSLLPLVYNPFVGPIEQVPTISLSDFCWIYQIEKMDMLWLSAEGNELQILKGAEELLAQTSLVYVRTQFVPSRDSITLFKDLFTFMEEEGFLLLSHFWMTDVVGDALFIQKRKFNP